MELSLFGLMPSVLILFCILYYFYLRFRVTCRKGVVLERKYLNSLFDRLDSTDSAERDKNNEIDIETVSFSSIDFRIDNELLNKFNAADELILAGGEKMTEKKFNELWVQISNAAQDILNSCGPGAKFEDQKKQYIGYEYDRLRDKCKREHMIKHSSDEKEPKLDRHKVAACVAGAILNAKPFGSLAEIDHDKHERIEYLANETLALFSALAIVKSFIREDKNNAMGLDLELKRIFLDEGYIFPSPLHSDYLPWLLFLLKDSEGSDFNVLAFSNILYLIESYTFSQLIVRKKET